MFTHFDLEVFIHQYVTGRSQSLFGFDLAHRQQDLNDAVKDRSVLVIGGAGTIGSAFVKALLPYKPSRLFVVDTNENGLTELTRDLRSTSGQYIPADYKTYPFNFGDKVFEKMYRHEGPFDIVAHFAAHKHVRSEKDRYSIEAMIENNVLRTHRLLQLVAEKPPQRFFGVSTDKAANPVNVMGASKKLMEEVLLAYTNSIPITTARFANVAFSNGSLPDGFLQRLAKRQPLSAPADVQRYFVSPQESGQLCLLACLLGSPGDIFFPKLPVSHMKTFSQIAIDLLAALGYLPLYCQSEEEARQLAQAWTPDSPAYPVYFFTSDTSGEKPYEEFYTSTETIDLSTFESLGVVKARARYSLAAIQNFLQDLEQGFDKEEFTKNDIIRLLTDILPEFSHLETGKGLDAKM